MYCNTLYASLLRHHLFGIISAAPRMLSVCQHKADDPLLSVPDRDSLLKLYINISVGQVGGNRGLANSISAAMSLLQHMKQTSLLTPAVMSGVLATVPCSTAHTWCANTSCPSAAAARGSV